MSLINDALKRTQKVARAQKPKRVEELELRPADASRAPSASRGSGTRVVWVVAVLVILCNLTLWLLLKDRTTKVQVVARSVSEVPEPPVTELEPATAAAPEPTPAKPAPQPVASVVATREPVIVATNPAPMLAPDTVRPEFKLKTILIHPVRPSAMINNAILFVGDELDGYIVTAIGKGSVTLRKGNDTLVLSLP